MELILLIITIILLLILTDYTMKPKTGNVVPGRIPIIGHCLIFWGKKPLEKLQELSEKYGCVYTIQIFNKTFVIVNGYEAIKEVLVLKGNEFGGRSSLFRIDYIYENRDIVNSDISPRWRRLRKCMHKILKQYSDGMTRIEDITNEIADDFVRFIGHLEEEAFDPFDEVYFCIINILCSVLTGKKYLKEDKVFQKYLQYENMGMQYVFSVENGFELDMFPWLRYLNTENYKMLKEFKYVCQEAFENLKKESVSNSPETSGLTSQILQELENESVLDENDFKLGLLDILGAGIATSTRTFYMLLHILSAHPLVQETVLKEVLNVLESNKKETLRYDDHREMPYTSACIQELLRYSSVVPLGLPHKSMVDATIQNVYIPKGQLVVANLWQLHHDDKFWKEPYKFFPERFLDENRELLKADHIKMRRVLAFGLGTRICLGQKLAQSRIFLLFTSVIRKYKIEPSSDENLHDPKDYEFNFIFNPRRGKLKFVPR